jgi:hypothetical protein
VAEVSARAWSELLHAEVAYRLRQADVPVLHIKGPSVALWLYRDGERPWGDVDILVPPSRMDQALLTLQAAGFTELYPGVNRHTTTDHAITLAHNMPGDAASHRSEVDVHDRFEGIEADSEQAFELLWSRRQRSRLAHVDVWFPDTPSRALLVAINTARDATSKAREDLVRLLRTLNEQDWEEVVDLARRLAALPALRAGLEIDSAGADVVRRIGLSEVEVSPEWRLRTSHAPRTALRLEELRRMPRSQRSTAMLRWLFPAPGIIRMRDPAARGGTLRLAAGYARRYRDGIRSLAPSLRALGSVRHPDVINEDPNSGVRRSRGQRDRV